MVGVGVLQTKCWKNEGRIIYNNLAWTPFSYVRQVITVVRNRTNVIISANSL